MLFESCHVLKHMTVKYLNIDEAILEKHGAIHTAREVSGQPELWYCAFNKVLSANQKITSFLDDLFKDLKKIILIIGEDISAFLGNSIEGILQRKSKITTVTVPTTHLVSRSKDYEQDSIPTLVNSFAKSGNSSESVVAVKLSDKHYETRHHLVITCNSEGSLAKQKFNDKSLAITGSYSNMLLTALLIMISIIWNP